MLGFSIVHMDAGTWEDVGREVSGLTRCDLRVMIIGNQPVTKGALAHEYVHALQNCDPMPPIDDSDPYHSNWVRDGIYDAIEKVRSHGN